MNVFDLRDRLVSDYQSYTRSFIKIRDPRIIEHVDHALGAGAFWPERCCNSTRRSCREGRIGGGGGNRTRVRKP